MECRKFIFDASGRARDREDSTLGNPGILPSSDLSEELP